MRKSCIVPVLLIACAAGARLPTTAHGDRVLEVRGAVEKGPYALGRADLAKLPRRRVRGVDPVTGRAASWEGPSVAAMVIDRVELAKGADTVVVHTVDREAVPIPLTMVRQWKPALAQTADGQGLATPVIAWPTLEQRGLETDPRSVGWWARGVVAFELVAWQKTFGPALAAPDGADDDARRGATWYGDRCIRCHRLRGAGGQRGPDLTALVARLRPAPFEALLRGHPGWKDPAGEEPSPRGAEEIWSFLRAVAATAPAPPAAAERASPEVGAR